MNTASTSSGPPAIPLNQQNDTIVQIVSPVPVPPPLPPRWKPKIVSPPVLPLPPRWKPPSYLPDGPNLPRSGLFNDRWRYIAVGVSLYEAATKGDWKAAKPILDEHPDVIRFAITENYDTLLHIAASAESTNVVEEFVTKLVQLMESEDLELQNQNYNTALSLAAAAGNVKTAMIMVEKNPGLPEIPGNNRAMPLYTAALFEKPLMVRYLYDYMRRRGNYMSDDNHRSVLEKCIEADIFDVAIKIIEDRPELTYKKELLSDILITLAQKTDAFEGTKLNVVLRILMDVYAPYLFSLLHYTC
ncbi:putative ankyrin repeat-containing domain-containing protein [Helianthus annuus]|nr:putative ankyrin repeat-containing domain-containing protein [Helianthus annuus]